MEKIQKILYHIPNHPDFWTQRHRVLVMERHLTGSHRRTNDQLLAGNGNSRTQQNPFQWIWRRIQKKKKTLWRKSLLPQIKKYDTRTAGRIQSKMA